MARRRARRTTLLSSIEIGLGVAILTGAVALYGVRLTPEQSIRAGTIAGAVAFGLWLLRPLLDWLWQKSAWWRRHSEKQWARNLIGFELALGSALLVGIAARYALLLPNPTSLGAAGVAGLAAMALWLLRPLFGWVWSRARQLGKQMGRIEPPRRHSTPSAMSDSEMQALTPRQFEELCAAIAQGWGYEARAVGESGDGGVDVEMWRDGEYVVGQCKRYKGTVPISQVRDFYGAMLHVGAKRGYFFTSGRFSDGAYRFVQGKPIELLDGPYLENVLARLGEDAAPRRVLSQ